MNRPIFIELDCPDGGKYFINLNSVKGLRPDDEARTCIYFIDSHHSVVHIPYSQVVDTINKALSGCKIYC